MIRPLALGLALTLAAASVAADVVIVDPNGQPGLPILQAAVDAAVDGDILLVRGGDYSELFLQLVIDGKGIHLVADEGGSPVELGAVTIRNVPANRTASLRGFDVPPGQLVFLQNPGVSVEDCAGAVWIEECNLHALGVGGTGLGSSQPSSPAVFVTNSAAVTVVRSDLFGARGPDAIIIGPAGSTPANAGGSGLHVVDGHVALYACNLTGGLPGDDASWIVPVGGYGLQVEGVSDVLVAGSALQGADEATDGDIGAMAGLRVLAPGSVVRRLDSDILGGLQDGQPVSAIDAPGGTVLDWPIPYRGVEATSPRRVGEAGTVTFTGVPGDTVAYFLSLNGGYLPFAGNLSVLSLGNPLVGPGILGPMPGNGELTINFVMPSLAVPASLGQAFELQIIVADRTGLIVIGGGGIIHQIDAGL